MIRALGCTCDTHTWDTCYCSRTDCDNVVCETHGGEIDGDYDDEGRAVNASQCGECIERHDDE